jgi:hypothetical protein
MYDDLPTFYVARWVCWGTFMVFRLAHQGAWLLTVLVLWLMTIDPLPPGLVRMGLHVIPRPRAPW